MFLTKEQKFRSNSRLTTHYSLLTSHCSKLTTQKRLEDVDMNSRGLLSPRLFMTYIIMASAKLRLSESRAMLAWAMPSVSNLDEVKDANRQPSPHVRVFQTPFFFLSIIPRVQEPAAIRPTGFPSSRRFFPTNIYHNVMLNLFNFVQFAHVDFVFLLLTRHSMQASSALVSFVGSA